MSAADDIQARIDEIQANITYAHQEQNDAVGSMQTVIGEAIRGMQRDLDDLNEQLVNAQANERAKDLDDSPEGKLLAAVARAFEFDYWIGGMEIEAAMNQVRDRLAEDGLQVVVEPIDE